MSPTDRARGVWLKIWTSVDAWTYDRLPPILWPVFWPVSAGLCTVWLVLAILSADVFTPRIYRK